MTLFNSMNVDPLSLICNCIKFKKLIMNILHWVWHWNGGLWIQFDYDYWLLEEKSSLGVYSMVQYGTIKSQFNNPFCWLIQGWHCHLQKWCEKLLDMIRGKADNCSKTHKKEKLSDPFSRLVCCEMVKHLGPLYLVVFLCFFQVSINSSINLNDRLALWMLRCLTLPQRHRFRVDLLSALS